MGSDLPQAASPWKSWGLNPAPGAPLLVPRAFVADWACLFSMAVL